VLLSLGAVLLLPHRHSPLQQNNRLRSFALEEGTLHLDTHVADKKSSACTLCILQRLLSLGLASGTPTVAAPELLELLAWTYHHSFSVSHSYPGSPRSPPAS